MATRDQIIGAFLGFAVTLAISFGIAWAGRPTVRSYRIVGTERLDVDRLLHAHGMAESSGKNEKPYPDGTQISWGLYAFGRDRWAECGGKPSDWGKASIAEQHRVMRQALKRYMRNCPDGATVDEQVTWTANAHNLGSGSLKKTRHSTKVLVFYKGEQKCATE